MKSLDPSPTDDTPSSLLSNLEIDILMYERHSRLPLNTNIVEFWSSQNNALSTIAKILLAIPATQVSVERLFSSLKYILADQRNRLTPFHLEHILMVKVNGVFNYEN